MNLLLLKKSYCWLLAVHVNPMMPEGESVEQLEAVCLTGLV